MGALILTLDTSVVVAMLTIDPHTEAARGLFVADRRVVASDLVAAEFASAIARRVRMREMTAEQARSAFAVLDGWLGGYVERVDVVPADIRQAAALGRRLELGLRVPDAIHIAVALRLDATLATFDVALAAAARNLGLVAEPT